MKISTWMRVLSLLLIAVSVFSMTFSGQFFLIDLFAHFQLQYLVLLMAAFLFFGFKKDYLFGGLVFLYGFFLFIGPIYPLQIFPDKNISADIFYMNVFYFNGEREEILNEIREKDPKILAIVEANDEFISEISEMYGDPIVYNREMIDSCAIFSREEAFYSAVVEIADYSICVAKFTDFYLLAVHPQPPFGGFFAKQKNFFHELAKYLSEFEKNNQKFILVGDFNSTYYSPIFRQDFSKYFKKNIYSWNVLAPLMLPIDHALSNIYNLKTSRGKNLSSDHVPILIEL